MDKKEVRVMPYNVEAERSVLGAMLLDSEVANDCCNKLTSEDFYLQANKNVFDAINELCADNKPIDAIAVEDILSQKGLLQSSGGLDYIIDLSNYVPSAASTSYFIDIIKRTSLSRTIIRRANNIIEKAYTEPDSKEVLQYAEKQIFDISKENETSTLTHVKKPASEVLETINAACRGEYKGGTMTGFKHFDNLTNGIKPGELILLAARPSVGKTAFALNVATNVAVNGGNVAIFSLEMPAKQLTARVMASMSKVNINAGMKNGFGSNATIQIGKIMTTYNELIKTKMFIDDSSVTKPMDIRSKCMRVIREHGPLSLIVVDYLQLMTSDKKTDGRQNEVADLSRSMKILAKELDCPILLLSQLSRAIDQRTDHTPKLSDLRESGAIEQDADMVLFLDKPYLNDKNMPEDDVKIVVAKHRNGELANLQLRWTGSIMKFDAVLDDKRVVPEEIEPPHEAGDIDSMKKIVDDSPFVDDGVAVELVEDRIPVADELLETTEDVAPTPSPIKLDDDSNDDGDIILNDMFVGTEEDNGELGY